MPTGTLLAYGAYLAWLTAGLWDFVTHWRTDLPHTSGVAESTTHLLQLGLLAAGVVMALSLEMSHAVAALLLLLVLAHAIVGYIDTRIAFDRHRVVAPVEQHLHSVLDMAPFIALAWLLLETWSASSSWAMGPRRPATGLMAWLAVLVPAGLLSVLPAALEFRAAWRARADR